MRPSSIFCASVTVAMLATSGCDWRDFDKLQAHTPVLVAAAPSSFGPNNDFGRNLLALSGPATPATGGRYIGSAASAAALGIISIDAHGSAQGQSVNAPVFSTGEVNGQTFPITSLAEVPGTETLLLGAPQAGDSGSVYVMRLGATSDTALLAAGAGSDRFGLGVAVGAFAGTAAPDFVVASGTDLTLFVDGDVTKAVPATPSADCPLLLSADLDATASNDRALLVAQLMGPGNPQILVGTPTKGAAGAVSVFTVDATGLATCAFAYRNPAPLFGRSLATGDFDADGVPDLLIGAPPSAAFWVRGPLTATSTVVPVSLAGAGGQLGASVAAVDVDGLPGDEAIVGDPGATVAGKMLAGAVHIVGGASLDHELPVLTLHDPGSDTSFGVRVRALPFCTSGCGTATATTRDLLLVGSQSHAFTYFVLGSGLPDPRK